MPLFASRDYPKTLFWLFAILPSFLLNGTFMVFSYNIWILSYSMSISQQCSCDESYSCPYLLPVFSWICHYWTNPFFRMLLFHYFTMLNLYFLAQAKLSTSDDETWKEREAAVLALGAVAEGCIEGLYPHLAEVNCCHFCAIDCWCE